MKWVTGFLLGWMLSASATAKVEVFACEPEWQSLVEALGGKQVNTFSATTAFQDPHHIEARPSLIAKARKADMLVCTGADLEVGWLPLLLRQSANPNIQPKANGYFMAAEQVERLDIPEKMDRSQGDIHAAGNPHVFWEPQRILTIAEALSKRLQKTAPDQSDYFQQRYDEFAQQWQAQIQQWEEMIQPLQGKKVIVYHQNWRYLLDWLGMETIGDLEPKPGLPPTSSHLASLLNVVREQKPESILIANYQDDKGAQWLSKKSGVPVLSLPFTVGGNPQAIDLPTLYQNVLTTLSQQQ